MELTKTKFKKTEVGLIPEDWNVVPLLELTNRIGDGIHTTPTYSETGKYFFVNGNNLGGGRISIDDNTKRVGEDEFKIHRRELTKNSILLSINGTIGSIAIYNGEPIILGKSAAYINVNSKVHFEYVYSILQTQATQKFFDNELTGSTIKNLGLGVIRKTPIPLPPTLDEQQAIATALSEVDDLITNLEKLIAKKKAIKQGAMQQLLTPPHKGGKRLAGFTGEWEEKRLGEFLVIAKGEQLNKDTLTLTGDYPVINGGIEPSGYSDKWNNTENTITISEGGNSCGYVNLQKRKFWSGGHCYTLKLKQKEVNLEFLYSYLKHKENLIMSLRVGSGLPNIQKTRLELFECIFPKNTHEQEAIAKILSEMDLEVEALESKLFKSKSIKQGMMQELLTGKTRLV